MLAKLQRSIAFALLVASIAAAAFLAHVGHALFGLAVALLLLLSYAIVLAIELVCLWCVETRVSRPSAADLIHAWWGEAKTFPSVFYWRQPFRVNAEPDHVTQHGGPRRGALLVHGLMCNRGFWNPWMLQLRSLDIPFLAVNLEPPFGSIDAYSDEIDAAMHRLATASGLPPVIIAHSMGGLAVRHWLRACRSEQRVHRVITIGTPHGGTWMARFSPSPSGQQMKLGSDWLARLDSSGSHARKFTCFYGDCDNVVFPSANARLAGADNRRITRTAHVALAFKGDIFAEALRWLDGRGPDQ